MIVGNWMQADPTVIPSDTLVSEANRILSQTNLHALPVYVDIDPELVCLQSGGDIRMRRRIDIRIDAERDARLCAGASRNLVDDGQFFDRFDVEGENILLQRVFDLRGDFAIREVREERKGALSDAHGVDPSLYAAVGVGTKSGVSVDA